MFPKPKRQLAIKPVALSLALLLMFGPVVRAGDSRRASFSPGSATAAANGTAPTTITPPGLPTLQERVARTSATLQSVKAMQAAARALAAQGANNLGFDPKRPGVRLPDVPNGLAAGGLQVDPRVPTDPTLWTGASQPQQTAANDRTVVAVAQTEQQALLNWSSFNIGRETTLSIDQSRGGADVNKWIAFNKVNDPGGVPSQILGAIQALGQVYVINPNGIIFGGTAQVNVNTLVASSLPLNDNLVSGGLLNNPDMQFLFSALPLAAGANGTPPFTPPAISTPDGLPGDVEVQAGARIAPPATVDNVGGRVVLVGANVRNQGEISTSDGQAILAAGLQVGVAAHSTADPTLRGLDVYVGAIADPAAPAGTPPPAGTVINDGLIDVPRGNATLAGAKVNQQGFIDSTTSVSLNGRVDLLASYNAVGIPEKTTFFPGTTGQLTLGADSVIRILPEINSDAQVIGTQLALSSQINMEGLAIYLGTDSTILAPNVSVSIQAGKWIRTGAGTSALNTFVQEAGVGQIYLDAGATIDVAGSGGVETPVSKNIVAVQLNAAELADSPLLRSGPLRGETIYVDSRQTATYDGREWIGTPLADARGYVNLIERTVGELTIAGGSVKMAAGESVVMQPGTTIDVSGGWISYQSDVIPVTSVLSAGHSFDVAKATPNRRYDAAVTTWQLEPGYLQGAAGGSVSIAAPAMALDGQFVGHTVCGPRQQQQAPSPSRLSLSFQAQQDNLSVSPTPPSIVFQLDNHLLPADPFALDAAGNPLPLRADRLTELVLSPDVVNRDGIGSISIGNSEGRITVPEDVELRTGVGGAFSFSAANLQIEGRLIAPSGSLQFNVYDFSPLAIFGLTATPAPDPARGHFVLGPNAVLSAAGTTALAYTDKCTPASIAGGTISVLSYSADLAEGSVLDVSGGVFTSATGSRTFGNGGNVSLRVGQDPNIASLTGGELILGSQLLGYSGAKGGSLSIVAPAIQIGGATAEPDVLLLSPEFFDAGGFSSFTLRGLGLAAAEPGSFVPGLAIAPNTVIAPQVERLMVEVNELGEAALVTYLPAQGLRTPVSLNFGAIGVTDGYAAQPLVVRGDLVVGEDVEIRTDPKGVVSLNGQTVAVLGRITAPGGTITISGSGDSAATFLNQAQVLATVHLGPRTALSAAGATLLTPNAQGYRTGSVLPGGTIRVSGNIVAEEGALLDVSGASDVLDVAPGYLGLDFEATRLTPGASLLPRRIESDAGLISLAGGRQLVSLATLRGFAGGPTALGGNLLLSSGRFYPAGVPNSAKTPLDVTLAVSQSGLALAADFYPAGETAIGRPLVDSNGQPIPGYGHFAADRFLAGGFDSLTLPGTVRFEGPVNIAANRMLAVANAGILWADANVQLSAPYILLGRAFQAPLAATQLVTPFRDGDNRLFRFSPTYGDGDLLVTATRLLDIGNLSLQNIGHARLVVENGDIRGDGTMEMAGHLTLRAGQIHPPTAVAFNIAAFDYTHNSTPQSGSVSIEAAGVRQLPLSAGGTLRVYASTIHQNGVLRAPLGTIQLGWDGAGTGPTDLISGRTFPFASELTLGDNSVTSVSAIDPVSGRALTLPYGLNVNGVSWIDPTGTEITRGGAPSKFIQLSGANVAVQDGAQLDIAGGGDLLAHRWVTGNGGSQDILGSNTRFAILPEYQANYAPYAPYNPSPVIPRIFGGDPGYVNSALSAGDRIYLAGSPGLPAGTYTLLPARYALLPGAFLVTAVSGLPAGETVVLPDGASVVPGYRFNDLHEARVVQPLFSQFEIAPASVFNARSQYDLYTGNSTLAEAAIAAGEIGPRLPRDSGQLVFAATQTMALRGQVAAAAATGGRGGLVDISSPQDILVAGAGAVGLPGVLTLDAAELSSFNAASLLIGGVRRTDYTGTKVTVQTDSITVDNAGTPLIGPDIVLAANQQLTLAPGAELMNGSGTAGAADTLLFGDASQAGSGNGALVRLSEDPSAAISRAGVNALTVPVLAIGDGAQLLGTRLILDSTGTTTLDPNAALDAAAIAIASGRISLALTDPGDMSSVGGLILSGAALDALQSGVQALSLLSYSSIDTYGHGQVGQNTLATLELHTAEIRGFNQGVNTVRFVAQEMLLDNSANGTVPGAVAASSGALVLDAELITLGVNECRVSQFAQLEMNATRGVLLQDTGGLTMSGDLTINAPLITGASAANQTIRATGNLTLAPVVAGASAAGLVSGLGGQLSLAGASVAANTTISLPSGAVSLQATAGDLVMGDASRIDVRGTAKTFFDQVRYTDGGAVSLQADFGSVILVAGSRVDVSAQPAGGNAGRMDVSAPNGSVTLNGSIIGNAGAAGQGGRFSLDTGSLPQPSLATLNGALNENGFTQARTIRVRNGDVLLDGLATARVFDLSADNGLIRVTGTIDASGERGGRISLAAAGSVVLESGARLTVAGQDFDAAGKGGSVRLGAGQAINGISDSSARLEIQTGAIIDLSVAAHSAQSAAAGQFTGTLHLRAPQTADNLDAQLQPINGTILDASQIVVEGYKMFTLTGAGTITTALRNDVFANGTVFAGNSAAIADRLLANNAGLSAVLRIRPGAEIINAGGDLTLDTTWDLSTFRFGPQNQPGALTLRATGNLNFNYNSSLGRFASLSDGFNGALYNSPLLAAGNESWSYRLVAGADVGAADGLRVQSLNALGANVGSLLLGKRAEIKGPIPNSTQNAQNIIPGYFQVIRTGTGDIEISAGRDVQLLSPLAAIYTAGTQAPVLPEFDVPNVTYPTGTSLGSRQYSTPYPAQYSFRGGNVTLSAQNDLVRYQVSHTGAMTLDSTREMPSNWLYRRGYVDPGTGQFGITHNGGEIASTTWWIDFSNFFQGVGALGGGNVTLTAGRDVANVDAVVPTNARMPKGTPDASRLVELGGGDLQVTAGRDINGGVYYIERGEGGLRADNSIRTNPSRAALDQTTLDTLRTIGRVPDSTTWLPTTLFLGKGRFDVFAGGDVLLGPVSNPFLLAQGINNSFWQKTYFQTYAPDAEVTVSSLIGSITFKDIASPTDNGSAGSLESWYRNVLLYVQSPESYASKSQPWLRLVETKIALTASAIVYTLMPPTLRATAFSGDLNVVGDLTLAPSPVGTIELLTADAVNGLQPNGVNSQTLKDQWGSSRLNLSDADPNRFPNITTPLSLTYLGPTAPSSQERNAWSDPELSTLDRVFDNLENLLNESGSYRGSFGILQTKLALHARGPLHLDDPNPVRVYAGSGDISGMTLFAGKPTRVLAGRDITDVALYLQNVAPDDVSVVSAGRDIVAYNPNSQLRTAAQTGNNELLLTQYGAPTAGDIQIGGPGTLEVLAGRHLDLGIGPNASDGTAVGITSIGNARNPNLSFAGADVIAAAGIGSPSGLDNSSPDFQAFVAAFLDPATGGAYAARYLPEMGALLGLPAGADAAQIWDHFSQLPTDEGNRLALNTFYLVLRDAGRDHNDPASPGYGTYNAGFAAIASLFPSAMPWEGDVTLTSRQIKTASGGNIHVFAPGGELFVGFDLSGNQPVDQGVLTESGGDISIFTHDSVVVGTSRIFTLRGGNILIWSSEGDIAAGASSKTVQSAPPTRVLIDPQSATVETDLAGLATGGGIGVLTTVANVVPGDVDLIAPAGVIDAGDAGIRVSGNINLAAMQVLNVANIQVQGASAGVPVISVSFNAGGIQAANASAAAATTATGPASGAAQTRDAAVAQEEQISLFTVEVLGYGGGEGNDQRTEEKDDQRKKQGQPALP